MAVPVSPWVLMERVCAVVERGGASRPGDVSPESSGRDAVVVVRTKQRRRTGRVRRMGAYLTGIVAVDLGEIEKRSMSCIVAVGLMKGR
jgi:hypothetical protein